MSDGLPETIVLRATIREDFPDHGSIVGDSDVDESGHRVIGLGIADKAGARDLENLTEGDSFEFAGATWQVAKIFGSRSVESGNDDTVGGGTAVAELTRIPVDHGSK